MIDWQEKYASTQTTLSGAIKLIPKGTHIFIGSGAAEPVGLVQELVTQEQRFSKNTVVHLLTLGPAPYVEQKYSNRFRHNAFFIGPNVRDAVHEGRADYTPVFLSQIPDLIRSRRMPVDIALIQVSPPDPFGFVNLGVSVDVVLAAVESAGLVIAEINPNMPVIHGAGFLPMSSINAWVAHPSILPISKRSTPDDVAREIGQHVASLVEDSSTLQVGIGQIPDAVLAALSNKKDLGFWTEMFSDGIIDLIENGNVTGKYKTVEPYKVTASFTFGSKRTYDFVNGNPSFSFQPSDYVNDPIKVAQQHKMIAINGALQIDLTGQVCSDSIGTKFYSGIGGQVDFIRGASMSPNGKPIIAIRSTARQGSVSRIVTTLDEGAGVVTSRGDVRYVVTEYGIADLQAKSIRERTMALISIAHPDYRAELLGAAKKRRYVFMEQIQTQPHSTAEYEKYVRARNGRKVFLRRIQLADEEKISDLIYQLSETKISERYIQGMPRIMLYPNILTYLETDDIQNIAIVIETQSTKSKPELLGIGRYHLDQATEFAEVAFIIRKNWRGEGLGTVLLSHLISIAKQNGVRGFTAKVLSSDTAIFHVFHKAALKIESKLEGETYNVKIPFEPGEI